MFDFGNANDGQRQAISTTEGPVLITAGPGTGKTYTLVQRAIYLIEERGVKPEDIFIATFTEKAAKELITRITNELASRNITVNVNEMYVGTFHSLCLRIIKDHLEYTRLKKNYRLLDTFDQQYLVFRNIYKFRTISGIENVMPKGGAWKWAQAICEFSNNLTEEVVDIDAMLSDVILLKEPKDSGYYEFSADENLVIEKDHNSFTPEEIKKSFHADTYCFDSKPEKECFLQYISSKKVKEIYFTGMFTANQGDLFVQYYDPESKRIRQYYPDFLAKMNDGSYQLIEVKGDNMIDDEVVKAKAEAAEEMSVASGMKYVMYAGSVLMKQNVLEHPPVTYSEEPSPLLMVAEDPVPYGK